MSNVFWCVASGRGYTDCPAELVKTLKRGSLIKAAAWRRACTAGAEFYLAIAKGFQKCDSESGARNRYLVDVNKKNGSLGTKLPLCDRIELKKVFSKIY